MSVIAEVSKLINLFSGKDFSCLDKDKYPDSSGIVAPYDSEAIDCALVQHILFIAGKEVPSFDDKYLITMDGVEDRTRFVVIRRSDQDLRGQIEPELLQAVDKAARVYWSNLSKDWKKVGSDKRTNVVVFAKKGVYDSDFFLRVYDRHHGLKLTTTKQITIEQQESSEYDYIAGKEEHVSAFFEWLTEQTAPPSADDSKEN